MPATQNGPASAAEVAPPKAVPFDTKLGDDVNDLAAKSPSLQQDMQTLQNKGWTFQYGEPGKGTYANRATKLITIDGSEKGHPKDVVRGLAHEVGHAMHPHKLDLSSKEAYVKSTLADEGAATLNNIRVQREILAGGGSNIGIAGAAANHSAYNKAYDTFLKDGNAKAAHDAIGSVFGAGEQTSNTNQPYAKYYGDWYDKQFPPGK